MEEKKTISNDESLSQTVIHQIPQKMRRLLTGQGHREQPSHDGGHSVTGSSQWKSCCIEMDQEAARFFALLGLTVFILGFSFYQLAYGEPCNQAPLWGLIGTMIGFWFDGPKMNQRNN